jgi:predicted unusual protein kinase regulating ubiquinone biosynthesis (AarF/ABC1/UbiB family)
VRTSAGWAASSLLSSLGGEEGAGRLWQGTAARAALTLGELKGLAMKVGQYVSFAVPDLPPELADALSTLQASAPPRPFEEIAAVAEAELGRPLAVAFSRFERTPVAAASIGQVHRAALPDGTPVAVKVQYPDVAASVSADLANVPALVRAVRLLVPGLDALAVANEIRARIGEELDYRGEADRQEAFAARFAGHPLFSVPTVFRSHSADRVLTSGYADGLDFAGAQHAPGPVRDRLGEILFRFLLECVFGWGTFVADPHPGNYRFAADGERVTFLDFGCVKRLPDPSRLALRDLVSAALREDREAGKEAASRLGLVAAGADGAAGPVAGAASWLYAPFRRDRVEPFPVVLSASAFRSATGRSLADLGRGVRIPGDLPFLNRTLVGMYAVLARLGARANWRRIALEVLGSTAR